MTLIDNFLNRITMYRLVLYYLIVLLSWAVLMSFFGLLHYSAVNLLFSIALILAVCWVANIAFAKVFRATPNVESVYITALILALIIAPVAPINYAGVGFLVFASAWAMASKYILALGKKHLFNPAAFGVALSTLVLGQSATWWVGASVPLLLIVVLGGLLIVRKIRRTDLVLAFSVTALAATLLTATGGNYLGSISDTLLYSGFFFLGLVMLTEPATTPPTRGLRILYGALVGLLFAPNLHIGSYYFAPEMALLAGNLFSYVVSPKRRHLLRLVEKHEIAANTYEFVFAPDRPFSFAAGQYLEWTLGHSPSDSRGNRRYFTIASSPTEKTVRLGVKFYEPGSTFKRAMGAMRVNDTISASQLSGDFVLPTNKNKSKKLVFIAGGIGVTPFRSQVQYLVDTKDTRAVTLLYSNKTASEIAYKNLFDDARQVTGLHTVYALTNEQNSIPGTYKGPIDSALIAREVPDYRERIFYISGPHGMVEAFKKTLRDMDVPRLHIKTDYFPGYT